MRGHGSDAHFETAGINGLKRFNTNQKHDPTKNINVNNGVDEETGIKGMKKFKTSARQDLLESQRRSDKYKVDDLDEGTQVRKMKSLAHPGSVDFGQKELVQEEQENRYRVSVDEEVEVRKMKSIAKPGSINFGEQI